LIELIEELRGTRSFRRVLALYVSNYVFPGQSTRSIGGQDVAAAVSGSAAAPGRRAPEVLPLGETCVDGVCEQEFMIKIRTIH
jgi:hypothetical protein